MGICFQHSAVRTGGVIHLKGADVKGSAPASLIPNTLEEEKRSMTQIGIFLMVRKGR